MLALNYRDSQPIYSQIKDGLRRIIAAGALEPGEKLPTVRSMAMEMALNPRAIARAYSELEGIPCVSDDNYGGGYLLASCLAERGHRHLAGIFKSDDVQGPQRYHGCISAIRDAGLPIHDRCFFWYDTEDRREMLEGRRPEQIGRAHV